MKRLMAEPERYGLEFAPIPNEPYFAVIDTGSQIDLKVAAQLAGTSYDELIALNPGCNRWATDPGRAATHAGADRQRRCVRSRRSKTLPPGRPRALPRAHGGAHETLAAIARQYGMLGGGDCQDQRPAGRHASAAGETLKIPQISVRAAGQGAARGGARRSARDRSAAAGSGKSSIGCAPAKP